MFCAFFARMDLCGVVSRSSGARASTVRARVDAHVRDAGRAPGTQHGESRLHQEDEDATVEEPVDVRARPDAIVPAIGNESRNLLDFIITQYHYVASGRPERRRLGASRGGRHAGRLGASRASSTT